MKHLRCLLAAMLTILLGVSSAPAQQPRFHALIVADTSPWAQWGRFQMNVQMDAAMMRSLVATNVPDHQLVFHFYDLSEDTSGDPGRIADLVSEVPAQGEDVFFFYYSGHGGSDDRGQYLAMAGGRLYRDEIRDRMRRKGNRLNVIITDCCNQRSDGQQFGAPAMDMRPPPTVTPLFRSLFFEPRGTVDINGSSPNEAAFFVPLDDESGVPPASLFTTQIEKFVYRFKQQPTTWDHFLRSVSLNVHLAFRAAYPNGATAGKGGTFQTDQNVYAYEYPGMPPKQGPRTGFIVRDHQNQGAMIVGVRAGFPASEVYDLSARRYVSLQPGEIIVAANNRRVQTVADIVGITERSPQVMRLTVRDPRDGDREVLMRLRY
jgi:hypothetical protein